MDKIARLRQEIERRKSLLTQHSKLTYDLILETFIKEYDDLLSFLDTLSGKDARPCWEKVHTYTEELREGDIEKMLLDLSVGKGKRKTKIALPDRVVDTLSEEPDKELEEEVKNYFQGYWPGTETAEQCNADLHFTPPAIIRLARHFAEWQKKQDLAEIAQSKSPLSVAYANRCFENGKQAMKEQMLKDAVEGKIYGYGDGSYELVASWLDMPENPIYKDGDKVRIIVLKAEEE